MARRWGHSATYHPWRNSTPVIDALATVLAVASTVIGAYAALFLVFALGSGDSATATEDAAFFVGIALAHGVLELLRRWRRHHG